jgi:hypothetical protein
MTVLTGWQNFYVIVGSSAGALIGLQFVVMTLITEMPGLSDVERASGAFATPTIVHFGAVLLLSALGTVPWHGIVAISILWKVLGLVGVVYALIVAKRMREQTAYSPVFEDWLFYVLLPLAAYATLVAAAFVTRSNVRAALFCVGATALLLLFVGIYNAWDTVTYQVFLHRRIHQKAERHREGQKAESPDLPPVGNP